MLGEEDVEKRAVSEKDTVDGSESEIIDNVVLSLKQKAIIVILILVFAIGVFTFGGVIEFSIYESAIEEIQKTKNSPVPVINDTIGG